MKEREIFEIFEKEYMNWFDTGEAPSVCDQDSTFLLEIQKKRLAKKGIDMRCKIKDYGDELMELSDKSNRFNVFQEFKFVERNLEFIKNGEQIHQIKNDQLMVQMIITDDHPDLLQNRPYKCPNCGGMSNVGSLLAGCRYCGTRFIMKDLFPVVNNFWFVREDSNKTLDEREKKMTNLARLLCFLCCFPFYQIMFDAKPIPAFFAALIAATIAGWFVGKVAYIIATLISSAETNGEGFISPKAWKTNKKISGFLSKYDPDFQYYYFEGQIATLAKICMMSEHPENLCCFESDTSLSWFSDVLDCMYCGHMILQSAEEKDGVCKLNLLGYFVVILEQNGKVSSEGKKIEFTIERNTNAMSNQFFSIHAVNCQSCGGSFDALHHKKCPFCSAKYDLRKNDWVITKIGEKL